MPDTDKNCNDDREPPITYCTACDALIIPKYTGQPLCAFCRERGARK